MSRTKQARKAAPTEQMRQSVFDTAGPGFFVSSDPRRAVRRANDASARQVARSEGKRGILVRLRRKEARKRLGLLARLRGMWV